MAWWNVRYDRPLERSACVACPFQSRQGWVESKRRWPEIFAKAVEIDAKLRSGLALDKTTYLRRQRMPLAEAVALDERDMARDAQQDGFGNEREGLETIESELADVWSRLDRLYDQMETTTEFDMAHFADRIRDHKERKERLESTAEGLRAVLDDMNTIMAYAQDMSRFLQKSDLPERGAFIETFVKEIELLPDNAVVRYSVPMPDDSLIPGSNAGDTAERLSGIFRKRWPTKLDDRYNRLRDMAQEVSSSRMSLGLEVAGPSRS